MSRRFDSALTQRGNTTTVNAPDLLLLAAQSHFSLTPGVDLNE
jgi:hypothetical protein